MAKPIFVMRVPAETVRSIGAERLEEMGRFLEKKLRDYHVLVMSDSRVEVAAFECFNAPTDSKSFKELKQLVSDAMKNLNNGEPNLSI